MGLLDDAIREHLELKRRRGADPSELERQENEALGPARRGEFARPDGEAPSADAPPEEPAEPAAEEPAAVQASAVEEPPAAVQAPPVEEPPAPVEEPPPAGPAPRDESEPWLDEPDEVPVDDALEHSPAEPAPDARTAEPDPVPGGDDVLEETPEFLQETPEHDRLWFEQKPPRDFDFDK